MYSRHAKIHRRQNPAFPRAGKQRQRSRPECEKQVRDAVGAYIEPYLLECENIEETRATVNDHMDEIIAVSKETLAANGFTYGASAELTHTDFPERRMETIHFLREITRRLK